MTTDQGSHHTCAQMDSASDERHTDWLMHESGLVDGVTMSIEVLTERPQSDSMVSGVMKALVYGGPGQRTWENKPKPTVRERGDAIVRITRSTICGTD